MSVTPGGTTTLVGSYEVGELVPGFELATVSGGTARLSDYRGRAVLIFFTATWCPYCGAEAPYLEQEIWQRYRDFLNMERFDAHASHVREFLDGFLGA